MEKFGDTHPLPDLIKNVSEKEIEVITSVLKQLLHRDPTEDDFKQVVRDFVNYNDNHYTLKVSGLDVGTIEIDSGMKNKPYLPNEFQLPTFTVRFIPSKLFAKE